MDSDRAHAAAQYTGKVLDTGKVLARRWHGARRHDRDLVQLLGMRARGLAEQVA